MAESEELSWGELLVRLEADLVMRRELEGGGRADDEAWDEAYRRITRYADIVLRGRTRLDPSDFQDIAHGVLLKLQTLESLRRLRAARSPMGYLMVVIRNAANDLARRRRVEEEAMMRLGFELVRVTAPSSLGWPEPTEALGRKIRELSAEDRHLLRLRFWKNLSLGEIASELGVSYSAVAVRVFRLLRRLRERLALEDR